MNTRLCEKAGKHSGRHIEAFCLQDACKKNRLLCFFCVFESHINHKIAYLHRELGGAISNLDQQITVTSKEHKTSQERMEDTFNKIGRACDRLGRASSTKMTIIKNLLNPQIQAVRKSFRKNSVDQILKDLTSNNHITSEKLERYANILKFYDKYSLNDVQKLEKNSVLIWESFSQLVNEAEKKIEVVFNSLLASVSKFDLAGEIVHIEENQNQNKLPADILRTSQEIIDKKTKENMEIIAVKSEQQIKSEVSKRDVSAPANEKVTPSVINQEMVREQIDLERVMEEQAAMIDQASQNNGILSLKNYSQPHEQNKLIQQQKKDIKIHNEFNNHGCTMVFKQKEKPFQDIQLDLISQWSPPNDREILKSPKNERSLRKIHNIGPQVEHVTIYSTSTHELNKMLEKINENVVKQLVIKCDTKLNILDMQSVRIISNMKLLTSLKIYFAKDLTEFLAIEMIKKLENLQQLVLAQFSNITPRLIEVIKTYNSNVSRVCFSFDMQCLKDSEQMLEFLPDIVEGSRFERYWEQLTSSSLLLSNIELQNATNLAYWVSYVKKSIESLKEITIIQTENRKIDYTPLIHSLSRCKNIQYLRLESLEFVEEDLIEIIVNNLNLKVFVLSECSDVGVKTYRALSKYSHNLKAVSISLMDNFTFKYPILSKQLQVLVIRGCFSVCQAYLCNNLSNLKKLRCLSVNFGYDWFKKDIFKAVGELSNLQIFNINNNKISLIDCVSLNRLERLNTFAAVNNLISYKIIASLNFAKRLKRLSISSVNGDGERQSVDLARLVTAFPNLTHLKLLNYRKMQGDIEELDNMKLLISVISSGFQRIGDDTILKQYCSKRRINYLFVEQKEESD